MLSLVPEVTPSGLALTIEPASTTNEDVSWPSSPFWANFTWALPFSPTTLLTYIEPSTSLSLFLTKPILFSFGVTVISLISLFSNLFSLASIVSNAVLRSLTFILLSFK